MLCHVSRHVSRIHDSWHAPIHLLPPPPSNPAPVNIDLWIITHHLVWGPLSNRGWGEHCNNPAIRRRGKMKSHILLPWVTSCVDCRWHFFYAVSIYWQICIFISVLVNFFSAEIKWNITFKPGLNSGCVSNFIYFSIQQNNVGQSVNHLSFHGG